ncbi:AAA family ATPase [Tautonia plasticadhaerens]|uniref:ATPase family associated with various cellular activities (AAA) n=1 Tax=Tautonia plasticadhaerens TaxID=2527974 RepID=A0A518H778_9BACT|nr:AAA family ATPase [Tautonia plasticadhaerens]QDV36718.1 ATPase family associated with various cellular activities (AAA) [Tautonia plasticadhaerens]
MPISFECERCRRRYQVDDALAGTQVRCKDCRQPIRIPGGDESPSTQHGGPEVPGDETPATGPALRGPGVEEWAVASEARPEEEGPGGGPSSPQVSEWADRVRGQIDKVYVGQRSLVRGVLLALLAGGHVLIESVPGLGKTLLVRVLGRVLGCDFNRIQFTPDLMPSDITGTSIFEEHTGAFRFRPGPVFTQLLLADEINRSPAKTHAALLEIMQEARVTVDGRAHVLPPPFLVMATQNPIESEGTYNLPEAQLDRFLFKLVADYPSAREETDILRLHTGGRSPETILEDRVATVTDPGEVLRMQRRCGEVLADDRLLDYIAAVVRRTREWPSFSIGASPRAGVAILLGARASAALEGRDYVVPDDVIEVALPALRHRVILTPEAEIEGRKIDDLLGELIRTVEVPRK